jgi:hypothetical protein
LPYIFASYMKKFLMVIIYETSLSNLTEMKRKAEQ